MASEWAKSVPYEINYKNKKKIRMFSINYALVQKCCLSKYYKHAIACFHLNYYCHNKRCLKHRNKIHYLINFLENINKILHYCSGVYTIIYSAHIHNDTIFPLVTFAKQIFCFLAFCRFLTLPQSCPLDSITYDLLSVTVKTNVKWPSGFSTLCNGKIYGSQTC